MGDISDTFMPLAAIAPLADAPITITGAAHARLKESDRISAVAENLRAPGIRADEGPDRITVHPGTPSPARIPCRRDHRIAMAFRVLGLRVDVLTLDDPACVDKMFPAFHEELHRLFGAPLPSRRAVAPALVPTAQGRTSSLPGRCPPVRSRGRSSAIT